MAHEPKGGVTEREARTRKNFRLHQSKLDAAQAALGTETETETIERALDLVAFGERLARGTARARGRTWSDLFGEMEAFERATPDVVAGGPADGTAGSTPDTGAGSTLGTPDGATKK